MGSPSSRPGRSEQEGPQHKVTIGKGSYLGHCELTQGQWTAVMGTQPWSGHGYVQANPNNPAVYVSWNDMQAFVHKLNPAAPQRYLNPKHTRHAAGRRNQSGVEPGDVGSVSDKKGVGP